jgi:adsorption protein B
MLLGYVELADFPEPMGNVVIVSMWINLFALITRYVVRVISGHEVYGKYDWIGIAMRWPAALYINMAAVYRAWKTFLGDSELATKPIVWSKTVHDIPDDFVSANR